MRVYFEFVDNVGRRIDEATSSKLRQEKLKTFITITEALKDYFTPVSIEMWYKAPLEALGGKLIGSFGDFEFFKNVAFGEGFVPAPDSIIRAIGNWHVSGTLQNVKGHFSVNYEHAWVTAYGDLNADIFSSEDLADLIFGSDKATAIWCGIFSKFIDASTREFPYRLHSLVLSEEGF